MLARGAACDTCRARKVKCDAARPYCSPCLKSARGDTAIAHSKCKYEGTSVAAAREAAAAAAAASGSTTTGVGVKKRRKKILEEETEAHKRARQEELSMPDYLGHEHSLPLWQQPLAPSPVPTPSPSSVYAHQPHQPQPQPQPFPSSHPPFPSHAHAASFPLPPASASIAHPSSGLPAPPSGPNVDELTSRVSQLERQLRLQSEAHAAQLASSSAPSSSAAPPPLPPPAGYYSTSFAAPHTRSPSFPFASSLSSSTLGYSLPPLSTALPRPPSKGSSSSHSTPAYPPPSAPAPSSYPPLQLPSLASSASAGGYPALGSPRPLSGSRTPLLASLSTLANAAGVGMDDAPLSASAPSTLGPFSSGLGGLPPPFAPAGTGAWSPSMAESHLRGSSGSLPAGLGHGANPSPVSSLRHLIGVAESERAQAREQEEELEEEKASPRHSLWGITNGESTDSPAPETGHATVDRTAADGLFPSAPTALQPFASPAVDSTPAYQFTAGLALLPPHYPSTLPPLLMLAHLVTAFFARATVPSTMLDRVALLRSVALGPAAAGHEWPDEALLHAICAYGSFFVSRSSLEPEGSALGLALGEDELQNGKRTPYWQKDGDESPLRWHYKWGKKAVEKAMAMGKDGGAGRDLFQVLQATILLSQVAYQSNFFTDLWLLSGTATRLCTPLGLNHLDPWDFQRGKCGPTGEDWGVRVRFVQRGELMGKPRDLDEHWRRSVTFWMAFAVDRFASASTDWSTSIDEKDISTHLPCAATMPMPSLHITPATGQIPSLSISSPTFLEDSSAPIGSLGLYIKASVLLGRVVNYLQRLPRARCVDIGPDCDELKAMLKAQPEFIELDVSLSKFKACHSANFYDASGNQIDGFLASAYAIPHVATILLHEPLTSRVDQSPTSSLARCLASAKCIVNSMWVLYQSSSDLGGCDPFLPFAWSATGRALVRDYATRRRWDGGPAVSPPPPADMGDSPAPPTTPPAMDYATEAQASLTLAEHCLTFMSGCGKQGGNTVASTLAETLEKHLADPDQLLPFDGTEEWAVSNYLEHLPTP
ncbi:hypothetical protein JCM11641_007280 [Rhodosporidiobolus odoratus]